jgi:hypothetical protein|tara:strand:- start:141 stop:362 length:222 start_codon:yes stop_codon:yes gene_type:complete
MGDGAHMLEEELFFSPNTRKIPFGSERERDDIVVFGSLLRHDFEGHAHALKGLPVIPWLVGGHLHGEHAGLVK